MNISVIIPIKNRAHLIGYTLDSILSQSKKPSEIIIVNDHSDDNLKAALKPYRDDIILIDNVAVGPGSARNTGFKISTGQYIQFFDSDDLMTRNKLEVQYKMLSSKSDDCFAYCQFVKAIWVNGIWQQQDVVMQHHKIPSQLSLLSLVSRGWCPITQIALFSRAMILETKGWREDIFTHEDLDFWFRVALLQPKALHSPDAAVIYRQHGKQLTDKQTSSSSLAKDHVRVMATWQDIVKKNCDTLTKIIFSARRRRSLKVFSQAYSQDLDSYFSEYTYRVFNKIQRYKTKSSWEKMHGISKCEELFDKIKGDLSIKYDI